MNNSDKRSFESEIAAVRAGDQAAANRLLPRLYSELRVAARSALGSRRAGQTLQTTALVHELYLRLVRQGAPACRSDAHFLALASKAMRQIVIDHARARAAAKRGGGLGRIELGENLLEVVGRHDDLLALDEVLKRLTAELPVYGQIVEMRFFGGMAPDEIARALGQSERNVRRQLAFARAWLQRQMTQHDT